MLLTHVIERAREGLSSCMANSRDPNDAIMTGPLGSWLCFPQCWLPMQMGFSSDTARWSQAAPGPHSTNFETGRKRELHFPSSSIAGIESRRTNLGHVTRMETTGHKCAPQRSGSA